MQAAAGVLPLASFAAAAAASWPLTYWHVVGVLHFRVLCSKVCKKVLQSVSRLHRHTAPLGSLPHPCWPGSPLRRRHIATVSN